MILILAPLFLFAVTQITGKAVEYRVPVDYSNKEHDQKNNEITFNLDDLLSEVTNGLIGLYQESERNENAVEENYVKNDGLNFNLDDLWSEVINGVMEVNQESDEQENENPLALFLGDHLLQNKMSSKDDEPECPTLNEISKQSMLLVGEGSKILSILIQLAINGIFQDSRCDFTWNPYTSFKCFVRTFHVVYDEVQNLTTESKQFSGDFVKFLDMYKIYSKCKKD